MELIDETPNYNYMILSTVGHSPPLIGAHYTPVVVAAFEGAPLHFHNKSCRAIGHREVNT